jgi:hypothetical protein
VEEQEAVLRGFDGAVHHIKRGGAERRVLVYHPLAERAWRPLVSVLVLAALVALVLAGCAFALLMKADGVMFETALNGTESAAQVEALGTVDAAEALELDPFGGIEFNIFRVFPGDAVSEMHAEVLTYAGSAFSVLWIGVMTVVYNLVAAGLSKLENHRTQTEQNDAAIIKGFFFQAINYYFVLMWLAFAKVGEFPGTGIPDACAAGAFDLPGFSGLLPDCIGELEIQLLTIFVAKRTFEQLKDIVAPRISYCRARMKAKGNSERTGTWEEQLLLQNPAGYDIFHEFQAMTIQFGFMTLFAVALPLAPAFAFVSNTVEMRLDAQNVCLYQRRLRYRAAEDIGSWMIVLQVLVGLSIITNGLLVTFSSPAVASMLVPPANSSATPTMPPCGTTDGVALYHSIANRYRDYSLWLWFVAMEHGIFLFKFAMEMAISEKPEHTTEAEDRQGWFKQKLRDEFQFGRLFEASRPGAIAPDAAPFEPEAATSIPAPAAESTAGRGAARPGGGRESVEVAGSDGRAAAASGLAGALEDLAGGPKVKFTELTQTLGQL